MLIDQNVGFRKRSPQWRHLKTLAKVYRFGVDGKKTELFENADVTATYALAGHIVSQVSLKHAHKTAKRSKKSLRMQTHLSTSVSFHSPENGGFRKRISVDGVLITSLHKVDLKCTSPDSSLLKTNANLSKSEEGQLNIKYSSKSCVPSLAKYGLETFKIVQNGLQRNCCQD